jgi:hypothetical protein
MFEGQCSDFVPAFLNGTNYFLLRGPSGGDKDRQCCFATLFPPRLNRFETPQDNNGHREQNEPERNIAGAEAKTHQRGKPKRPRGGNTRDCISPMKDRSGADKPHARIPKGSLMISRVTKESPTFPVVASKRFPKIMLADAVRQTRTVVRSPAGRPCSLRFAPTIAPAAKVTRRRTIMSHHVTSNCMIGSSDIRF